VERKKKKKKGLPSPAGELSSSDYRIETKRGKKIDIPKKGNLRSSITKKGSVKEKKKKEWLTKHTKAGAPPLEKATID